LDLVWYSNHQVLDRTGAKNRARAWPSLFLNTSWSGVLASDHPVLRAGVSPARGLLSGSLPRWVH